MNQKFEVYTFFAVSTVLVGYIMQFIGLRGMRAWVSLAQLGITIVMSILRGFLRMQRLEKDGNELAEMPDLVAGHELDWLAFEIARQDWNKQDEKQRDKEEQATNKERSAVIWNITVQHEKYLPTNEQSSGLRNMTQSPSPSPDDNKVPTGSGKSGSSPLSSHPPTIDRTVQGSQFNSENLLRIRARLSRLTTPPSFISSTEPEWQEWKDNHVKVRTSARRLSAAICQASDRLLPLKGSGENNNVKLQVRVTPSMETLSINLESQPTSMQTSWSIDSAQLEAILGLWMWLLVSDKRLSPKSSSNGKSIDASVKTLRIVSALPNANSKHQEARSASEMGLWLGDTKRLSGTTLTCDEPRMHGFIDLWGPPSTAGNSRQCEPNWQNLPRDPEEYKKRQFPQGQFPLRLCGWNSVCASMESRQQPAAPAELKIQYVATERSLRDICAQELFVALMVSLKSQLPKVPKVGETTFVERAGYVQLHNPTISALEQAFVENGLGSRSDALYCIIPAFKERLLLDEEAMLSALTGVANTYRRERKWLQAETVLQCACMRYFTSTPSDNSHFVRALVATGELYRWSLALRSNDERRLFGMKGIKWMRDEYSNSGEPSETIREIQERYQQVAERFEESSQSSPKDAALIEKQLVEAIKGRHRTEALYLLCFITTGAFDSRLLQPALPLAVRNDWFEVVSAILEMKAKPNSGDENDKTALSYSAEFGFQEYIKPLVDQGAFLDLSNTDGRTPLWTAGGERARYSCQGAPRARRRYRDDGYHIRPDAP
jgi:hypothetical protein